MLSFGPNDPDQTCSNCQDDDVPLDFGIALTDGARWCRTCSLDVAGGGFAVALDDLAAELATADPAHRPSLLRHALRAVDYLTSACQPSPTVDSAPALSTRRGAR